MIRQGEEKREGDGSSVPLETGGFDTLHEAIYGGWDEAAFGDLTSHLDAKRLKAEAGEAAEAIYTSRAGECLRVQASGATLGCYYRWVCEWNGCRLYILNRCIASDKVPAIFVQIGSLTLMTLGEVEVHEQLRRLLVELGFQQQRQSVSRADVCVDLPGHDVKEFTRLACDGHEITKAKHGNLHFGGKIEDHETFYRGGGRVLMRIYDKLKEVARDPAKEAVLIAKRWGGVKPVAATRVEFQINRDVLREKWGVETPEQLRQALPQMVEWLTAEWYRLTATVVDRENRNHARASTADVWQKVQAAFAGWVTVPPIRWTVPHKAFAAKADQLRKQAFGCIKKLVAVFEPSITTGNQIADLVARMAGDAKRDLAAGVADVRAVLRVHYGGGVNFNGPGNGILQAVR